uniref:Wax synthase domain-containing protein n=1 Tax=Tetradesmus obliquus TaxID=3088 RepID=A0A383VNU6_TETOB|eukprot:jgi/Sobl393_1/13520/SZX67195.1
MHEVEALNEFYSIREYGQRLQLALTVFFVFGSYLHFVVRRLTPGWVALAASAPVCLVSLFLPLLFSNTDEELLSRGLCIIAAPFLGNLKVFGLCCNRGPLAGTWSWAESLAIYLLPIVPKQEAASGAKLGALSKDAGSASSVLKSFLINTALLACCTYALSQLQLPKLVSYYIYCYALYGFLTMAMDGTAALLLALLHLHIVPAFDKPWRSLSLTEFWGRRWNNIISLSMRAVVYEPILEGRLFKADPAAAAAAAPPPPPPPPPKPAAAAAVPASREPAGSMAADEPVKQGSSSTNGSTSSQQQHGHMSLLNKGLATAAIFTISGLEHEWFLFLMLGPGEYHPGYWMAFFLVQVPLMIGEGLLLKQLKAAGIRLPKLVRIAAWQGVLLVCAYLFWYPPVQVHSQMAPRAVAAVNRNVQDLVQGLQQLGQQLELGPLLHLGGGASIA